MTICEAIDVTVVRGGCPQQFDYELMEAAERLASEVARMRKLVREEVAYREERWKKYQDTQSQNRLAEAREILSRIRRKGRK